MATVKLIEINRSNAARNYLEHIDATARTKKAIELEASLYDGCGMSDAAMKMADEIDEAKRLCEAIGGAEGTVLRRHYIDGEPYSDIAVEMAYSERQIGRFAKDGRVKMFDLISPAWQNTVLAS